MAALTPFRIALLEPPAGVTSGSGAGAWGSWTGSATGVCLVNGTAAGAWGSWTGTGTGVATFLGTATGTWGAWTGAATGTSTFLGSADGAWGSWTGTVTITRIGTAQWASRNLTRRFSSRRLSR